MIFILQPPKNEQSHIKAAYHLIICFVSTTFSFYFSPREGRREETETFLVMNNSEQQKLISTLRIDDYQLMLPYILSCAAIVINQEKTKYLKDRITNQDGEDSIMQFYSTNTFHSAVVLQ